MRARKAAFGAAAFVLAALVYSAIWWIAADRLRGGFDGWAAEMRARGWSVSYERFRIEGYPGPLAPIVEAPSLAAPEALGGWRWQGPRVTARAWPWNPSRIAFTGAGEHRLRPGSDTSPIRAKLGIASGLLLRPGTETRIVLTLGNIAIRADGKPPRSIASAEATIVLPDRPGRADAGRGPEPPGPTIALSLAGIELGGPDRGIDGVSLNAKLTGPVPRAATARALAVWRDGGGVVEIGEIVLRRRRARVNGSGTVAFDRDLQPIAALSLRIEGRRDLVRALVAHGAVEQRDAGAVGLALQLVAGAGKGRGGGSALPVTVQDRRLFLGPLSVMRLPRIDWDG